MEKNSNVIESMYESIDLKTFLFNVKSKSIYSKIFDIFRQCEGCQKMRRVFGLSDQLMILMAYLIDKQKISIGSSLPR